MRHALRLAGAFAWHVLGEIVPCPSVHDVVVIPRTDLAEVLRVPAEYRLEGELVVHLRERMDELDEEAFLAERRS